MTWSNFSKMFGSPMCQLVGPSNNRTTIPTSLPIIMLDQIKPLSADTYKAYDNYFQDKSLDRIGATNAERDLPAWFNSNWHLFEEPPSLIDRLDFHGLNKAETQYWLEYMQKNPSRFNKKVNIITGRGNHSRRTINIDISTKIMTKNDSTGILEDFVFRWLKQHRYRFVKRLGQFDIYNK